MNPELLARLEKTLVLLLVASFPLPLLLGYGLHYSPYKFPHTDWLRNRTLNGVQVKPASVPFSRASLLSAEYQEAYANNYATRFTGRELFIRVINEIYLRGFPPRSRWCAHRSAPLAHRTRLPGGVLPGAPRGGRASPLCAGPAPLPGFLRETAELKARATVPVFPIGGIHWGDPAALATTNAALGVLAGQGLPVGRSETTPR